MCRVPPLQVSQVCAAAGGVERRPQSSKNMEPLGYPAASELFAPPAAFGCRSWQVLNAHTHPSALCCPLLPTPHAPSV